MSFVNKTVFRAIILLSFVLGKAQAQDVINFSEYYTIPVPASTNASSDELKNLKWYRYVTDNFVILSISKEQGSYIKSNIENFKSSICEKWSINNFSFPKRLYHPEIGPEPGCIIVCVPNKSMLQDLLGLTEARTEVIKDEYEKIKSSAIWTVVDEDSLNNSFFVNISNVVLSEYDNLNEKTSIPFWGIKGMSILTSNKSFIRRKISFSSDEINSIDSIIKNTESDYYNLNFEERMKFDANCASLVLLLRKEYGYNKMFDFLNANNISDKSIREILRFESKQDFTSVLKKYIKFLNIDILENKTPDSYLEVELVKK